MFSHSIAKLLSRNPKTSSYFTGCYPADMIPPKTHHSYPYCMVVNMDCSGWEGSHWVSIFVESKNNVEYYDSLGDWPPPSPYIENFLAQFPSAGYSKEQVQSAQSSSCGRHAIYFLSHRCSGIFTSLDAMLTHFRRCRSNPDIIVNAFVRNLINEQS